MVQVEPAKRARFENQSPKPQPFQEPRIVPGPIAENPEYPTIGKLKHKVALITGGDSGIGRAVAVLFARAGADISIIYYNRHRDAAETKSRVEEAHQRCLTISGDVGFQTFCTSAVKHTCEQLGRLDILVNNAAVQYTKERFEDICPEQIEHTFRTNIFSMFYITLAALKFMTPGSVIINTTSVTAYRGSKSLVDYSATEGAIVAFTRSLALALADRGIRVNGVAPDPIQVPSVSARTDRLQESNELNLNRAGQPEGVAPSYLFLATNEDSSNITGQILHPNGGEVILPADNC